MNVIKLLFLWDYLTSHYNCMMRDPYLVILMYMITDIQLMHQ